MAKNKIDKGTLIVENDEDKKTVARYLKALAEGDETYQPPGLKRILPGQEKEQKSIKQSITEEAIFRDNRANINFI